MVVYLRSCSPSPSPEALDECVRFADPEDEDPILARITVDTEA